MSQMSKYAAPNVLQFTPCSERAAAWVEGVMFVYLFLDRVGTLNLIPRDVSCMVKYSTWKKFTLQEKRKGQCFAYLGCEGEGGSGGMFHGPT